MSNSFRILHCITRWFYVVQCFIFPQFNFSTRFNITEYSSALSDKLRSLMRLSLYRDKHIKTYFLH